jgi:hypothetical protein
MKKKKRKKKRKIRHNRGGNARVPELRTVAEIRAC